MSDPAALLRANRRRRAIRRGILVASIPVLLVALAACVKVLSMYAFAYASAAAYATGDYPGTSAAARGQEPVNVFEPWKAPFNVGVGLTAAGDLDGGRAAFEQALALATGLEQCAVRVNLAITLERIGDRAQAAGDPQAAQTAWQEALLVLREAPEGCRTAEADENSPDPDQNMEDTLDEEERRLREKLEQGANPTPPEEPEEPQQSPTEPEGLEEIEDLLQQGQDERDEYHAGDEAPWTDRPW